MSAPQPGRLLVANPLLPDANFERSVVLVLARNADGALGVVLNRPGAASLAETLPRWADLSSGPGVIFEGGPVSPDAVICLARITAGAVPPAGGWSPMAGDLATVDLDIGPEELAGRIDGLRVFAGYAGWGPGQLEAELDAEAWWVLDARRGDVFSADPEGLWGRVLRRQGGSLQLVASYPDDPTAN